MTKRTISLAAVAAAAALWSSSAGAQDQKVYGVLLKTLSNPFWGAIPGEQRRRAEDEDPDEQQHRHHERDADLS
jgi:ABC-type sugar transport system substrate-binding protein